MSVYDFIIDIVTEWCIGKYWCDMLVTLQVGGEVFSTILEYDAGSHAFTFVTDWYEGECRVQLLGFKPLAECLVLHDPDGKEIHDATWRRWR